MKYIIQAILIVISFFASWMAKKQFRKAIAEGNYDVGLYYKLNPLTGEKAIRMAKRGLFFAQTGPWLIVILLVLYDLL
jgi:hypothetical protein